MTGPQVIAHRGSSEDAPEHTLAAYVRAVDEGADALECDIRLTADGSLVCVHDRRIDRTSDGHGVVSALTLAELDARDFGRWKPPVGSGMDGDHFVRDEDRRRVLTLGRLLELIVSCESEVQLAIETKHPTRYAGLVEQRLVQELTRFGLAVPRDPGDFRVRVMSFSPMSIRRMRELSPRLPNVFLMERVPLRFREGRLPFHARIAGPSIEIVRAFPRYVAKARAAGHQVHVWTVDSDDDVDLCIELGVDAIITNRPGKVLAHIGRT